MHNSAQLRCFENGNDDFGVEAFWIGDAARVGYFVPLNGPLNGHPPSVYYSGPVRKNLSSKFDAFLAGYSQFDNDHRVDFYAHTCCQSATSGPLFAFYCPLFLTKKKN